MKIQFVSDLHLEFESQFRIKNAGSDLLILGGDICTAMPFSRSEDSPYYAYGQRFKEFFEYCSNEFEHVLYIMGNHESYQYIQNKTEQTLRETLAYLPNINILENEYVDIGDVRFLGTTLWTDMNKNDPITMSLIKDKMNDFRVVQVNHDGVYRKFQPYDASRMHDAALKFIDKNTVDHDKCFVLSHHAPSTLSISKRFANDFVMNGGYASDLSEFILDRPQIKMWTHGHVHHNNDYELGSCRIMSNPRGYDDENPGFMVDKIVEL